MSDELRLNEVQLPEGTKNICGKAVRFAFVSECDGSRYVSADRIETLTNEKADLRHALEMARIRNRERESEIIELRNALNKIASIKLVQGDPWPKLNGFSMWEIAREALQKL